MADETASKPIQSLVDSFRALLDEALIVAIASDYNLKDTSAYDAAHTTLRGLAQSVPSEEATGFNASGIPVLPEGESDEAKHDPTASTSISHQASQTQVTDQSSTDASSATAEPLAAMPRLTYFDNDSNEYKVLLLQSMFTELKEYDINYSLKKANGDFQTALDDLLNIQYLESTGQQMKGLDGFFTLDDAPPPKSKRKKRKGDGGVTLATDLSPAESTSRPTQVNEPDEIEYIAERFGICSDEVSGVYYKNQRSKGGTVVELLNQYISHGIKTQDDAGKQHADHLTRKYRHVPNKYMPTIVYVTGTIPQFADDLAALLNKHFSKQPKSRKLDLGYRLTPLPREDIQGGGQVTHGMPATKPANRPATCATDLAQAIQAANSHHQAKNDCLATAAQLRRRGASSPLYRQAASYYADRAREQARHAHQATSTAADMLVEQQSTACSIDLHGVLVHDGVRIALERTRDRWQGLGEFRSRKAREQGFTVVTGLGRHNTGGVSQMRQAVAAALLQDGWKIRIETGRFVVAGRR